jgi:hypothetical protein
MARLPSIGDLDVFGERGNIAPLPLAGSPGSTIAQSRGDGRHVRGDADRSARMQTCLAVRPRSSSPGATHRKQTSVAELLPSTHLTPGSRRERQPQTGEHRRAGSADRGDPLGLSLGSLQAEAISQLRLARFIHASPLRPLELQLRIVAASVSSHAWRWPLLVQLHPPALPGTIPLRNQISWPPGPRSRPVASA